MTISQRPVVAAFDVDGTLTTRDCVMPFLYRTVACGRPSHSCGSPSRCRGPSCTGIATASRQWCARHSPAWTEKRSTPRERIRGGDREAMAPVRHVRAPATAPGARPRGRPRLRLSRPVSRAVRVEHRRGTGSSARSSSATRTGCSRGSWSARTAVDPRRSPTRGWLVASGMVDAVVWAYGDSAGDDELLARADHPIRVGPGARSPRDPLTYDLEQSAARGAVSARTTRGTEDQAGRGLRPASAARSSTGIRW